MALTFIRSGLKYDQVFFYKLQCLYIIYDHIDNNFNHKFDAFLRVIVNNTDFLLKGIDAINKVKIS
jgi:hypothetical protein